MKLRCYVGCGLTHAPKDYREQIEAFKKRLRTVEWIEVLDFVTENSVSENPDPVDIYKNDIHRCVGTAHVMIADLTHPSTGLGWELGASIEKYCIRVIMCAKQDVIVSHLPLGAAIEHSHFVSFDRYQSSIDELFDFFLTELEKVRDSF